MVSLTDKISYCSVLSVQVSWRRWSKYWFIISFIVLNCYLVKNVQRKMSILSKMLIIFPQLCNLVMIWTHSHEATSPSAASAPRLSHYHKEDQPNTLPSSSFLFPVTRMRWAPSHLLWTRSPAGGVWCSDAAVFLFTLPLSFYSHLVVRAPISAARRSLQVCCITTSPTFRFNTSKYSLALRYYFLMGTSQEPFASARSNTRISCRSQSMPFWFFCVRCIGTYDASRHLHLVFMY